MAPGRVLAQALPPGWHASPCDANGNAIYPYFDTNSFYTMSGTDSGTASNTYPLPMINAALADPTDYGFYLNASTPLGLSPMPLSGLNINSIVAYTVAENCVGNYFQYSVPGPNGTRLTGNINGSITVDTKGQLVLYFKVYSMGGSPPMPASFSLLLQTNVSEGDFLEASYPPGTKTGLSAYVTATDGPPFNETISASAGDAAPSSGPTKITGYHLVTASVNPATGIAEVYLNGHVHSQLSNTVPATAGAALVQAYPRVSASVKLDSRSVTISAGCDPTTYKLLTGGVDANGDGKVATVTHLPTEMKGDIGISYGSQHLNDQSIEVVSSTYTGVKYTGHIPGNWATQNSHYWWNSSLKNYSTDGSLYRLVALGPPLEAEIPTLGNTYDGPTVDTNTGLIIPNDAGANGTVDSISFQFKNGDNRNVIPVPQFVTGNDGDGATAIANYALKIHQPVEIFPSHRPNETHYRTATPNPRPNSDDIQLNPAQPGYAIYGGGIACTWNDPNIVFAIASAITDEGGDISFTKYPWISAVSGLLNIGLSNLGPKPDTGIANFSDTVWNNSTDFPPNYPKGSTPKTSYHMVPLLQVMYTWQYFLKDNYASSGFVNEELDHAEKFQGTSQWLGHFYYYPHVVGTSK